MRTSAAILGLWVLGACTPVAPDALDLREDELDAAPRGAFPRIPDGEREVATEHEGTRVITPPVEPERDSAVPRYLLGGDGSLDDCFHVSARGLPAIDVTGTFVATSEEQWLQLSPQHGRVSLRVQDLLDPEETTVVSVVPAEADIPMDETQCRRMRARTRKAIAAANAELAAHRWRALEPLAVEYGNGETSPEDREAVPVSERPLQVIVQHDESIVRIPGVRVYERHVMTGRSGDLLYAVHGDHESGVVALTFADCIGDSCTCDPLFTTEIVQWSPQTFAALRAHPCSDPEAEDGRCRAMDYGF